MMKKIIFLSLLTISLKTLAVDCRVIAPAVNDRVQVSCEDGRSGYIKGPADGLISVDNNIQIFRKDTGTDLANPDRGDNTCMWMEKPEKDKFKKSEVFYCKGKAYCKKQGAAPTTAQIRCLEKSARKDCLSATRCANATDDELVFHHFLGGVDGRWENGEPLVNPIKEKKKSSTVETAN